MKSTWFKDPLRKAFAEWLEAASGHGRHSMWETFTDFLDCAHASLWQGTRKAAGADSCPETEADYLRAMGHMADGRAAADAMGILVTALERQRYDFLGTFAGEAGLLNEWGGQFFTPTEICRMMAAMTIGEAAPDPSHRLTICEPAVGAGGMVLAVSEVLIQRGFAPRHWWIDATDIDHRMAKAAYIQLSLCGVPGVVRCGDSLRLETRKVWPTLTGAMFPLRREQETPKQAGDDLLEAA